MIEPIASVQALIVGAIFAWAGIWKVCFPRARALARQSALATILRRPRLAEGLHLTVGLGEIGVAALLLLLPQFAWGIRVASAFAVGFLGYLWLAWRVAPEKPCACMGGRSTRISKRSLVRAVLLLAFTVLGWFARHTWGTTLLTTPLAALLVVAELGLLWCVSPEFDWIGPKVEKQFLRTVRLRLNPTCSGIARSWHDTESDLRRTAVFHELSPHLATQSDRWRDGCWSFVSYAATYEGQKATAVFAVPVLYDPVEVSAAVVRDTDGAILIKLATARSAQTAMPAPVA
jgi:hypothetical protein